MTIVLEMWHLMLVIQLFILAVTIYEACQTFELGFIPVWIKGIAFSAFSWSIFWLGTLQEIKI